jgi:N-acetylglucosamine-6-sulfatase
MQPNSRRTFMKSAAGAASASQALQHVASALTPAKRARNVIFILTDDHRFDAMGFMHSQSSLKTAQMDALARDGDHLKNVFVNTALCSPSRASILTGVYAHRHKIVDNNTAEPPGTRIFPQLLQKADIKQLSLASGIWETAAMSLSPVSTNG